MSRRRQRRPRTPRLAGPSPASGRDARFHSFYLGLPPQSYITFATHWVAGFARPVIRTAPHQDTLLSTGRGGRLFRQSLLLPVKGARCQERPGRSSQDGGKTIDRIDAKTRPRAVFNLLVMLVVQLRTLGHLLLG